MGLRFQNWGFIEYEAALTKQEFLAAQIARLHTPGEIIFCIHPPVITKGRKTQEKDIFGWSGSVVEVKRGGRATYHGPSQLVIYPLLNLSYEPSPHPRKDVSWVIRTLERSAIEALDHYGIKATGKTMASKTLDLEDTGVWIEGRKLASIGIGVTNWVSYHGMAINLFNDPEAFKGLLPCGYEASVMTSIEKEVGKKIDGLAFQDNLLRVLLTNFG